MAEKPWGFLLIEGEESGEFGGGNVRCPRTLSTPKRVIRAYPGVDEAEAARKASNTAVAEKLGLDLTGSHFGDAQQEALNALRARRVQRLASR